MEETMNKEEKRMDELKLVISTKFMRNLIAKLLAKTIYKKTGYKIGIQINKIEANTRDEKVRLSIDADAEMSFDDLKNILKNL